MKKNKLFIIMLNFIILMISAFIIIDNKNLNKDSDFFENGMSSDDMSNKIILNDIANKYGFEIKNNKDGKILKFKNDEYFVKNFVFFQKVLVASENRGLIKYKLIDFDNKEIKTSECLLLKSKCTLNIERAIAK